MASDEFDFVDHSNNRVYVPQSPSFEPYLSYRVIENPSTQANQFTYDEQWKVNAPQDQNGFRWVPYDASNSNHEQQPEQQVIDYGPWNDKTPEVPRPPPSPPTNQIESARRVVLEPEVVERLNALTRLQNSMNRLRKRMLHVQHELAWLEKRSRQRRLFFFDSLWRSTNRQLSLAQERIDQNEHQMLLLRNRLRRSKRVPLADWQLDRLLRQTDSFVREQHDFVKQQTRRVRRIKPIMRDFRSEYHLDSDQLSIF